MCLDTKNKAANDRLVETYAWSTQVLEDTLDFSYERDHITWPMQVNQELCRRVEAIFDGVHDDLGLVDPQDSILKLSVENLYELLVSLKGVPISKSQYWFCVEAGHIIVHYRNRVKKAQAKITPPGIDNRPQRQAAQGLPARQKETLSGNKSKSAHASNGLRENPPKNEPSSSSRSRAANASASKDSTIEKSRSSTTGDRRSSTIKEGEPSTARKGKDLGTTYSTRDRETKGIRGIKASGNMGSGSPSDKIHTKYSEHREYQRRPHRASKYEEPRRRPARPRDESSLYS